MINLLATSYLILESETLAFLEFLKEVPVFFSVCFIKNWVQIQGLNLFF